VGQRSTTETLAGVYQAFLTRRTWKQADLARELDVSSEAVRRVLHELQEKGMPLDREEDHPHVYWSVPKGWFPESLLFKREEIPELLRQLRRIPHGQGRARLLALVIGRLPGAAPVAATSPAVVARDADPQEDRYLSVVEDSAGTGVALFMRYLTAGRVEAGTRHVSVHRVLLGPPARFVGTCHRSGTLKTFRADGVLDARLDPNETFRLADVAEVDAYVKASLDGFNEGGTPATFSFVVRNPEARWVKNNLLGGMQAEPAGDGIRVTFHGSALGRLARFVVSLGAAATAETPALVREVETRSCAPERGAGSRLAGRSPVEEGRARRVG
jgi:predicted DNA-binding transcriptional regulator YafY